jgi:hypothetical protein
MRSKYAANAQRMRSECAANAFAKQMLSDCAVNTYLMRSDSVATVWRFSSDSEVIP